MKRFITSFLALMLIIGLNGCGDDETSPVKITAKILVVKNIFGATERIPVIEVFSVVDNIVIKNVIANNGNCKMGKRLKSKFPYNLKYGQKATAGGYTSQCNLMKIEVVTDKGTWEQEVSNLPEQYVQM
jgi:hypothetical protein